MEPENCVYTSLNHGMDVAQVGASDTGKTVECDAIFTKEKGVGLFLMTADCFGLVVYDPGKMAAVVHLGYRGVGSKLVQKVIKEFKDPSKLKVMIGPGARKESYVFEDVLQKDEPEWQAFLEKAEGRIAVDLAGFIKKQLVDAGVASESIDDCGIDTVKDISCFSHYRSVRTGEPEGRFATVVVMG